jgi:hypothetical protein
MVVLRLLYPRESRFLRSKAKTAGKYLRHLEALVIEL